MYRLTITGNASKAFLSKQAHSKPIKQRVYRWENKWGYLRQGQTWEESWLAEERTFVGSVSKDENIFLVETYTPIELLPPVEIDDMWEEEVVCDKNITCNSLLSITGSKEDLMNVCKAYDIELPSAVLNVVNYAT